MHALIGYIRHRRWSMDFKCNKRAATANYLVEDQI
ncbi:hypothetical protein BofuT4_uP004140.1 [Botrytis cinerea T4]|uniref:Uncharacterized protein n=1 Tax=Botryotinia fuckeliana (strain T4) TaxID=999810 RepID=G2Y3L5_BOTF4|nr:hypothetical protein BofuT4_uP004140.1 [Botrytis cinerea T4]